MPDIQNLPVADLKPWPRNARVHSRKQVKQLAQSIRRFGFTHPILVDEDNRILAGHGRVRAAQELRLAEVPCLRISHLSQKEKRAYVLADNKLALNAKWDHRLLAEELGGLVIEDIAIEIGFSIAETETLIADCPAEKDAAREDCATAMAPARCQVGDIWQLGSHLLICRQALSSETVNTVVKEQLVQMLIALPGGAAWAAKTNESREWPGATLLSAERTGRRVIMSTEDTSACDRIVQRWEARTKKRASRISPPPNKAASRVVL